MIVPNRLVDYAPQRDANETLARIPQRTFGDTGWVTLALKNCAEHLAPAIRSGKSHRIANAVRAIAHAPTLEQIDDVVGVACDTVLSEAYAIRDTRLVSNVATARTVIDTVIADLRGQTEREAIAPFLLRETVDAYVQLTALIDQRLAERLDAVGRLAGRIGSAMRQPACAQLEVELAGRLHDIGALATQGTSNTTNGFERSPLVGETFLKGVPSLAHLAPIVRSHREHFDGSGYPDGLRGAEIPLGARIICVAALFVDLVTERPEQAAVLPHQACYQLRLFAGTRFDPEVVAAGLHFLHFRHRTRSA